MEISGDVKIEVVITATSRGHLQISAKFLNEI